jgi:hypothetical protein
MNTTAPRTRQSPARETEVNAAPVRRRVPRGTDRFAFDQSIQPDGWIYEWKRHTILGQEDPGYMAELTQVGYSAVPAERHPGVFLPADYKGSIIMGGQILMERPVELHREAKQEERRAAVAQKRGSFEQFGLQTAFDTDAPNARRNTGAKSAFETVEAPKPKYDYGSIDE